MLQRCLALLTLASIAIASAACRHESPPPTVRDSGLTPGTEDPLVKELWKRTRVALAVGQTQNLVEDEPAKVTAALRSRGNEVRKCFEQPIRRRGCRTGGIPRPLDAMLMIDGAGVVQGFRVVPNKNDLPKECHDAVICIQDAINGLQVPGLSQFGGMRQAYSTITLLMPDEEDVAAELAGGGSAGAPGR